MSNQKELERAVDAVCNTATLNSSGNKTTWEDTQKQVSIIRNALTSREDGVREGLNMAGEIVCRVMESFGGLDWKLSLNQVAWEIKMKVREIEESDHD